MASINKLKFSFFGTPLLAKETLEILEDNGYIPSIIITSPDSRSGRGMNMNESPVSIWAKEHNIKCLKPEKIDSEFINNFRKLNIDLSIVVAYGKILPEELIKIPKLGTVNIHYSLLPKYRGASPLESALLKGDTETGVSIQQMVFKLDSGPVLAELKVPIDLIKTKEEIRNVLIQEGGNLLCKIIPDIENRNINSKIQDESYATYCTKINKKDGEINLKEDGIINYNKYRAFYGWPGVFFFINKKDTKIRIKIKQAVFENGLFIIKRVVPEGKKEISFEDFLRQS